MSDSTPPGSTVHVHRRADGTVDEAAVAAVIATLRPLLQRDGGDAELAGIAGGTVRLRMVGGCAGCPSAVATMATGIERILKDRVPGVTAVVAAD